jgi:uncharacterized protein (TIGR02118 family)
LGTAGHLPESKAKDHAAGTDPWEGKVVIRLIYCISKKASLTDEEFFQHWSGIHGQIGARIPGLRQLVQCHRLTVVGDKHQPDYDGVAELWFDNMEALLVARQSSEWEISTQDEANFIDHTKVAYSITEEYVVFDQAQPEKH